MREEWPDWKVQKLRDLWSTGLSATKIGAAVSMSHHAVIGKAHRLGLESRPSPIKRNVVPQTTRRAVGQYRDHTMIDFSPNLRLQTMWVECLQAVRSERGEASQAKWGF